MSSMHVASQDDAARAWWTVGQKNPKSLTTLKSKKSFSAEKPSQAHRKLSAKSTSGSKLNTLASAIGLKSKKQPTLTIEEPPSPIADIHISPGRSQPIDRTSHAQSLTSTIYSLDDFQEPRTPSDKDRYSYQHSLLTLSDNDPFASRGISMHVAQDPNRLSVYINNPNGPESAPPMASAKPHRSRIPAMRSSYTSSSSHSVEDDHMPNSPVSLVSRKSNYGESVNGRYTSFTRSPASTAGSTERSLPKSDSLVTLTDKKRMSEPEPSRIPQRLPMRARGMTESGTAKVLPVSPLSRPPSKPAKRSPPPSSSTSQTGSGLLCPRVVVRQASLSQVSLPSKSPPIHMLPPPPAPSENASAEDDIVSFSKIKTRDSAYSTASTLSFASSASSVMDLLGFLADSDRPDEERGWEVGDNVSEIFPRFREGRDSGIHPMPSMGLESSGSKMSPPSGGSAILKKALSHQSLKRSSAASSSSHPMLENGTSSREDLTRGKLPRKQRSFHHPKILLPAFPLPLRSSTASVPRDIPVDAGRDSFSSSGGRKRLFSGSSLRRPSTSQTSAEDDIRSDFSVSLEHAKRSNSPAMKPLDSTPSSSFRDDSTLTYFPSSPTSSSPEYVPQPIMTREELREIEASLDNDVVDFTIPPRSRTFSFQTISSVLLDMGADSMSDRSLRLPVPGKAFKVRASRGIVSSEGGETSTDGPPRAARSQPVSRPSTSDAFVSPRRPPAQTEVLPGTSPPFGGGLSPAPRRPRQSLFSDVTPTPEHSEYSFTPLSPPPRRFQRSQSAKPTSAEPKRVGIMKKPSFLDIDDDHPREKRISKPVDSSFLDLTRESFDTLLTLEERNSNE